MILHQLLIRKANVLLGSILSALGLSGCISSSPYNQTSLYGVPYAKYDVHGAILDADGKALEGMEVRMKEIERYDDEEVEVGTSHRTTTDAQGQYSCEGKLYGPDVKEAEFRVVVEDPSGRYASDSTNVKMTKTDAGATSWCLGTMVGEVDMVLKEVKEK